MRVLVFGSTGQVGRALAHTVWPAGCALTFLDRKAADFSQPFALGEVIECHRPDAVVIAAAYTHVDKAESEEALATTINATAPGAIAEACAGLSIPVVHLSTDYVFDGEKAGPYDENDPVAPIGAYGRSKLAGEVAVRQANPRHLVLRTSWVYDSAGTNFLLTMLRLAECRDEVCVVADQVGCPTAAADIADAIARILPTSLADEGTYGTYHMAGSTSVSWHGFAEAIFENLAGRGMRRPRNRPITTAEYPTPGRRPKNSRLACEAFGRIFGFRLRGFEAAMPRVLDQALASMDLSATPRCELAQ